MVWENVLWQVPFHYQIANHDHENATFVRYNELVSTYERSKGTWLKLSARVHSPKPFGEKYFIISLAT